MRYSIENILKCRGRFFHETQVSFHGRGREWMQITYNAFKLAIHQSPEICRDESYQAIYSMEKIFQLCIIQHGWQLPQSWGNSSWHRMVWISFHQHVSFLFHSLVLLSQGESNKLIFWSATFISCLRALYKRVFFIPYCQTRVFNEDANKYFVFVPGVFWYEFCPSITASTAWCINDQISFCHNTNLNTETPI